MNEIEQKLIMILYECNQHEKMIKSSYKRLKYFIPLTEKIYLNLTEEEMGYIDQFLFRFSKLQDAMGEKVFSTVLFLLGEDFSKKPFIDLLNRLEKMEFLHKDDWLGLRKIRNDVAHEYSFNVTELVDSLNDILNTKDILLNIYHNFYRYCFDKFDFIKNSEVL